MSGGRETFSAPRSAPEASHGKERATCAHCGTPFTKRSASDQFCCEGCHYVSNLLHEGGHERFYQLKDKAVVPPVGSRAFKAVDEDWLHEAQLEAEVETPRELVSQSFGLEGISCIGCVWLIEALFKGRGGASQIQIHPQQGRLNLVWKREVFRLADFAQELQRLGYAITPKPADGDNASRESKQIVGRIGLCGFFLMNTMLFTLPSYLGMGGEFFLAPIFEMLAALFATLALALGGSYFIKRAYQAAKNRVLHIDLPIATGLSVAYAGSLIGWATGYTTLIYFDFVATFVFLMLVGRWLQEFAVEKNRNYLQRQQVGPKEVTTISGARDGEKVSVSEVTANLEYSVAPGEINPVSAEALDQSTSISLEWINGEAEPVVWPKERLVPAGAINVGISPLRLRARENWESSMLAKLLERPEDTFQDLRLQTVLKYYIAAVLLIAGTGWATWFFSTGDLLKSTQVLISILIVSCPCATGVALPLCNEFATSRLRKLGLFIRTPLVWERLRQVKTVVFDKTGTLTMDVPRLTDTESVRDLDPLSSVALFHLVNHNSHPVGRALREALIANHPQLRNERAFGTVEESIGKGVSWTDPVGNLWTLGKYDWQSKSRTTPQKQTQTALRQNGLLVSAFECTEDVRDDAKSTIEYFRHLNLKTVILSGDAQKRVDHIRAQLDLAQDAAQSQCSPTDKADWIKSQADGEAMMIGDGANDSLAFDAAVCRGTPVVDKSILESSADFFFFGRSLRCLSELFRVARRRRQVAHAIFATAAVYNTIAIGLCLAGLMHPILAAILMPLSSVATLAIAWTGLSQKQQIA